MSDYEHLIYEQKGPVTVITINRPDRMNAIGPQTHRELVDAGRCARPSSWRPKRTGHGTPSSSPTARPPPTRSSPSRWWRRRDGQVFSREILSFIRDLDTPEIHGYQPDVGYRVYTEKAIEMCRPADAPPTNGHRPLPAEPGEPAQV